LTAHTVDGSARRKQKQYRINYLKQKQAKNNIWIETYVYSME